MRSDPPKFAARLLSVTTLSVVAAAAAMTVVAAIAPGGAETAAQAQAGDPHGKIYAENMYPTAAQCGACHTQIYQEWASSSHAYASISPMFHKFEQAINDLSSGTVRSFCVRCHQQVGTQRGEQRWQPLWERSQVAREGVTCITCHRITEEY